VLDKIRDLGLPLLSVERLSVDARLRNVDRLC
jgi:hypothetical protein